jgi:hypothetical protein
MKQTRQAVSTIKWSILLRCLRTTQLYEMPKNKLIETDLKRGTENFSKSKSNVANIYNLCAVFKNIFSYIKIK